MCSSGSSRTSIPGRGSKEQDLLTDPTVLAEPSRVADVVAGVSALGEFKAWLRKTFVCDTFTTPDELGRKIAVALSNHSAPPTPRWREQLREVRSASFTPFSQLLTSRVVTH